MPEKRGKFVFGTVKTNAQTEAKMSWHRGSWLFRVQFPGVEVEDDRLMLADVDALDSTANPGPRKEAEVTSSTNWKVYSQKAGSPYGKFYKSLVPIPSYFMRESGRPGMSIEVVKNRVDAGIILKPFIQKDVKGPFLLAANGKAGCSVAYDGPSSQVLQKFSRTVYIITELSGALPGDQFVTVPMAGYLVARSRDPYHHFRVLLGDLSQHKECCQNTLCPKQLQGALYAQLNSTFESLWACSPRCLSKNRRVVVLFNIYTEGVHNG